MNYLSGGKKSILGTRLSSRYLSSDAFTSSTGKTGGRSISQLGSLFGRKNSPKRFSGTGQHIGLFELKNILFKSIIIIMCFIVIGYTIPFLRYGVHGFFTQTFTSTDNSNITTDNDTLQAFEHYVSPVFGATDRFVVKTRDDVVYSEGITVYATKENILLGVYTQASSSKPEVILLSEVGQKNNMFVKTVIRNVVAVSDTATTTSGEAATSTPEDTQPQKPEAGFTSVVFEGYGYGQLKAQVPPQEELELNTILYIRTENGLVPAARVSYLEKDTGSTFTNIYAQLLVPPFQLYKVRIGDVQK